VPRPPTPKVRNWGDADEKFLYDLIRSGAVDINDTSLEIIKRVRQEYFQQRSSKNFCRNFGNYAARHDLEESYRGSRQRAAKEGKLRVCFLFVNSLPAIDAHERQGFNELRGTVVSCRIFICSQSLIAR
jgi:hypothetical protein